MKELRAEIKMMNFPCFLDNFAAKKEKDKSRFSLCFKFRILINVLRGRHHGFKSRNRNFRKCGETFHKTLSKGQLTLYCPPH